MIDWDVAISTGTRFARQGPQVSLADARAVVAELRGLTAVVQQPVRELTGLTSQGTAGPVAVVDRHGARARLRGDRPADDRGNEALGKAGRRAVLEPRGRRDSSASRQCASRRRPVLALPRAGQSHGRDADRSKDQAPKR